MLAELQISNAGCSVSDEILPGDGAVQYGETVAVVPSALTEGLGKVS